MLKMFTGDIVPQSGIYRVVHEGHRLPHLVTLLAGEKFPRCSRCDDKVHFEVVQTVPHLDEVRERIVLHELPAFEHDDSESVA